MHAGLLSRADYCSHVNELYALALRKLATDGLGGQSFRSVFVARNKLFASTRKRNR